MFCKDTIADSERALPEFSMDPSRPSFPIYPCLLLFNICVISLFPDFFFFLSFFWCTTFKTENGISVSRLLCCGARGVICHRRRILRCSNMCSGERKTSFCCRAITIAFNRLWHEMRSSIIKPTSFGKLFPLFFFFFFFSFIFFFLQVLKDGERLRETW